MTDTIPVAFLLSDTAPKTRTLETIMDVPTDVGAKMEVAKVQESLDRIDKGIGKLTSSIEGLVKTKTNSKKKAQASSPMKPSSGDLENEGSVANDKEDVGEDDNEEDNEHDNEEDNKEYNKEDSEHESEHDNKHDKWDYKEDSDEMECPPRTIAEVRICNWERFKNRFSQEEAAYAIEILVAGASLRQEIEQERCKRMDKTDKMQNPIMMYMMGQGLVGRKSHGQGGNDTWIQCVRINSGAIMKILGRLSSAGETWKGKPHTFFRPFRYLIYFHDQMKEELRKMKERVAETLLQLDATSTDSATVNSKDVALKGNARFNNEQLAPDSGTKTPDEDNEDESNDNDIDALYSSKEALEDVQCYINFVEDKLLPAYHQFDNAESPKAQKVRYENLWYLFKVGDLIYVPNANQKEHAQRLSADQTLWRVYRIQIPTITGRSATFCNCADCKKGRRILKIYCYYIDYDGKSYGAITKCLTIKEFDGEQEVTQLQFYPVKFMKDSAELLNQSQTDGINFVDHISKRYGFYSGWTMTKSPTGEELEDAKGKKIKSPEHIESDVLVDFAEAFNSYPHWKPELERRDPESYAVVSTVDSLPVKQWTSPKRSELIRSSQEKIADDDGIEKIELNKLLGKDQYLVKREKSEPVSADDLVILPRRMLAYSVWERKFVHIDSRYLKRTTRKGEEDEAFKRLQIDDRNKALIQSLVHAHFKKKEIEQQGFEVETQDLIRGKGKGIVILLHGVPGVGKTATAEAVARKWQRPLFPITCGDLGFTAESVENSLNEIFRLAHLWDCVLLLDEADVFITQRERNDLQRNALVSVFLRMLEYYNGILFLTTNRAGVLDEAVKSRVHLNLKYDYLNEKQTVEIFKLNIERLKEIEAQRDKAPGHTALYIVEDDIIQFAKDHYTKYANANGMGRWNGRQIRNAFLIAASLAHYECEGKPNMQKQLRASHFALVDETTIQYDQFRFSVLGGTDGHVAFDRSERDDASDSAYIRSSAVGRRTSTQAPQGFQGRQQFQPPSRTAYQNSEPMAQRGGMGPAAAEIHHGMPQTQFLSKTPSQQGGYGQQTSNPEFDGASQPFREPRGNNMYDNSSMNTPQGGNQGGAEQYIGNSNGVGWTP